MLRRILAVLCAAICIAAALGGAMASGADEYRIEVDVANQITTVYRCSDGTVVRQMLCSTGLGDATPRGTFKLQQSRAADRSEWYFIGKYQCYVKYPTRIQGSILFHSIPYSDKDMNAIDAEAAAQLGSKASHGCVRLRWQDAKWIAENCPDGTETRIFTGTTDEQALRQLLMKRSYSTASGIGYERFTEGLQAEDDGTLGLGDSGDAVESLQRQLGRLGYYGGKPSAEFDTATVVAVMRFQQARGLLPTGLASPALIAQITAEK